MFTGVLSGIKTKTQTQTTAYNPETSLSATAGNNKQLFVGHMPLYNFVFYCRKSADMTEHSVSFSSFKLSFFDTFGECHAPLLFSARVDISSELRTALFIISLFAIVYDHNDTCDRA